MWQIDRLACKRHAGNVSACISELRVSDQLRVRVSGGLVLVIARLERPRDSDRACEAPSGSCVINEMEAASAQIDIQNLLFIF